MIHTSEPIMLRTYVRTSPRQEGRQRQDSRLSRQNANMDFALPFQPAPPSPLQLE
jgi:hypothetical protein